MSRIVDALQLRAARSGYRATGESVACDGGSVACDGCGMGRVPQLWVNSIVPKTGYNAPISTHVGGGNAMVSHHFVSQLVLFALIWLFIVLHLTRPKHPVTAPAVPTEPEPLQSKRSRSNEPKPFEGLTQKPHCALCARDTAYPKSLPPVPPDPMAPTHRRPREVDTSMHFCPHSYCDYRGWL